MSARVADVMTTEVVAVRADASFKEIAAEEIRREITDKIIIREYHADPALVTVTVTNGVVTLDSTPEAAITGHKIADEVRHMEGVVAVRERVSHPPGESVGGEG